MRRALATVLAAAAVVVTAGCGSGAERAGAPGDADIGRQLVSAFGCGGCHRIGGVRDADGRVGPSLRGLAGRRTIAGALPNTPATVARWVHDPPAIDPATLMPDLGITRDQARDIAAYLYDQ